MKRFCLALLCSLAAFPAWAIDIDRAPIEYSTAPADNRIADLIRKYDKGDIKLKRDEDHGYLKSLLKELDVPLSSQVLVYSKTSLQRSKISPRTPRAIYFNDDVTVGFCRSGDVLELAAADPNLGTVFYTLSQNPERGAGFKRQGDSCLICHASSANQGMPGHLVRSVTTDRFGEPVLSKGSKRVDHSTPFEHRWGGWYVTGRSGKQLHVGNRLADGWPHQEKDTDGSNVTDLKSHFTVANYPTVHSDLVALMVMEHQGETLNRLTRANYQTRQALHEQVELNKSMGDPVDKPWESITRRIHWACEPVVQYLLFSGEAKLTDTVEGTSDFAKEFAAKGPFDAKKRSLREFDLKTRMFRYPMSYLIYSKQFDGLHPAAKERIYRRLWEVLSGKDTSKEFSHLSKEDRTAILEILRETKKDLPADWK